EFVESPTSMQGSFIQHSIIDPEKSTVTFDDLTATFANALNSPGGTITFPDCDVPAGLVGENLVAISASCNPAEALPTVYPALCAFVVVNCNVPPWPLPAHVPPVTSAASAVPVAAMYT